MSTEKRFEPDPWTSSPAVNAGAGVLTPPSQDSGPSWTVLRKNTTSADATGGVDLTTAPTSTEKIVIDDLIVSVDTDMNISFTEETTGTEILKLYLSANVPPQLTLRNGIKLDTADKKLKATASVAGNIAIFASWHSEA